MTTIYKYTNRVTGKVYVGKTIDVSTRKRHHAMYAARGKATPFYRAIRKYGEASFDFEILVEVPDADGGLTEMIFIAALYANIPEFGYNLTYGGDGTVGFHHSNETRKKISESPRVRLNAGRVPSLDVRERTSTALKGRTVSQETRRKLSLAMRGKNNRWKNRRTTFA